MKLEWLVIGGGIHGVHLAAKLLGEGAVDSAALRIVDPGERLLHRWRECTAVTGMRHLRSPSVHHLDLEAWSLRDFADRQKNQKPGIFARPYSRPALSLFNAHCERVIEQYSLDQLHLQARAVQCHVNDEHVSVALSTGEAIDTRNIVLALGSSEQPNWPDWASKNHTRMHHIFAPDFEGWPSEAETVAVIGGGISAGQVALRLVKQKHKVHLISRHALRQHQFDSDPGWLGPRYMTGFSQEQDFDVRRAMITEARHKGSVPPNVRRALKRALRKGTLLWHEDEVIQADTSEASVTLNLSRGDSVRVDRVLLATGFSSRRPGGSLVDQLISSESLPCASCGYPLVDEALRWHPRIHVSGPLAELELGPTSRNISGARRAADRLLDLIRSQSSSVSAA